MQTFVPFANYKKIAKCLDRQRLGKQRVECTQILSTLVGMSDGWASHPAVKMWVGHTGALCAYTLTVCEEWVNRGYTDNCMAFVHEIYASGWVPANSTVFPKWWRDERVHDSHKAMLLRKDYDWYLDRICGGDKADAEELMNEYSDYVWPVGKAIKFREV